MRSMKDSENDEKNNSTAKDKNFMDSMFVLIIISVFTAFVLFITGNLKRLLITLKTTMNMKMVLKIKNQI